MKEEIVERPEKSEELLGLSNDSEHIGDIDDFIFADETYRCSER